MDPYLGFFDPSALANGFAPRTDKALCPSGRCYPAQQGYVEGRAIEFYELFTYRPEDLSKSGAPLASRALSTDAFDFPDPCSAERAYDPVRDAFRPDVQYPIFSQLPVSAGAGAAAYPFVARREVHAAPTHCNDLKTADSVSRGAEGARAGADPADHRLWAIVDSTATFARLGGSPPPLAFGWFKGLQVSFLDGGAVPTNDAGDFVPMEGVLVSVAGSPSKPSDAKAVILPKAPSAPGYSPIVALRPLTLPAGAALGDFTGICAGAGCAPTDVDITAAGPAANFVVIYAR